MRFLTFLWAIWLTGAIHAASKDPCTNGSFEELAPSGFPVDWAPVGSTLEVSADAHSGRYSLRLLRSADTSTRETGLNRAGRTRDGRSALIDRLGGGIDFHYKAVSAENAELNVYAIPMTEEPVERTGSPRATFTVPESHIGDGQWHHARLKYDFTDNPKVKWVHFAARIVGTAGELLLDDFSYVERVGGILRFGKVRLEEDLDQPGRRCTVRADVENAGDALAEDVRARIQLPGGLRATPIEVRLRNLAPDERAKALWTVEGSRTRDCRLGFSVVSGSVATETSFAVVPKWELRSFGPVAPVAKQGEPFAVECVLENTGRVILKDLSADFTATSKVTQRAAELVPGRSVVLSASFQPTQQTPSLDLAVRASAKNVDQPLEAKARVAVGSATKLPDPSGKLQALATDDYAILENKHIRLAFRGNEFGFGPGELSVASGSGWQTVAWLPRLNRVVYLASDGSRREQTVFAADAPGAEIGPMAASLRFQWTAHDSDGRLAAGFALAAGEKTISTDYELTCDQPATLLAFEGPMLYVLERDEAVFPGLEWLVGDEVSSGTLDIAEDHPHRIRYVVHPNMVTIPAIGIHSSHGTVGLLWDIHQKWDGVHDRPSVVFASPDRFENHRAHLAGLFLPTVPDYVEPNAREAVKPYPLEPGKRIRLRAHIFADGTATDALAAVDQWARLYGWPKPGPLPHGSYDREIEFSMQAYLKSLWEPETKEWWTTKGNAVLSKTGRPRLFVADLLVGEILSSNEEVRRACRARAEEVLAVISGQPRLDAQRFHGRADLAYANPARAAGLLAARDEEGAWRFDADYQPRQGPFVGRDYYDLGPDEAVEVGTCARKAFEVLRYARIAGDAEAYQRMQTTLELMETFRVPRAAQVWEVPVHTPDVLAAADAVDAYVEAYRFSGEKRWLRNAVTWARRGLPFIYMWDDPEKPFLLGASIPVFGATWHRGSWFGRAVQWNGLRYANALLKLSEYDDSYPWHQIAETVIRSAVHQQDLEGENVALWPDNISAIDSQKCPWIFAPRQIIRNVLKLIGRDEDPATVIVGRDQDQRSGHRRNVGARLHITATAQISEAAWDGNLLCFHIRYPQGEQGLVLVSNVARPDAVELDGKVLPESTDLENASGPGWRYDAGNAYLAIRVARRGGGVWHPHIPPTAGESTIRVQGAAFREVRRLPWPRERIAFEFEDSLEGWLPAHDIADMFPSDGALVGTICGKDPYLIRALLRLEGDQCPVIHLRMRVTGGTGMMPVAHGGQLFWTTESSPSFGEDKAIRFTIKPDGQFHQYRLEPGQHPLWSGQTITAIRIDPGNGAQQGEFAIDYIRGEKPF